MFTTGISPDTQATLAILTKTSFLEKYFLAGGTAVALHYGHRLSYDLDFFSPDMLLPNKITQFLQDKGELEVDQIGEGTWLGMLNKVKLSFFVYPYPEVGDETDWEGVRIASKLDLACMKMEAIGSRGIKRDFIDMYYLTKELGLGSVFEAMRVKFAKSNISELHFLRSLVYFEQAEESEDPTMIHPLDWDGIKRYFEIEVKKLSRSWEIVG